MQQRAGQHGKPVLPAFGPGFGPGFRLVRRVAHAAAVATGVGDFMRNVRRASSGVRHGNALNHCRGGWTAAAWCTPRACVRSSEIEVAHGDDFVRVKPRVQALQFQQQAGEAAALRVMFELQVASGQG